ncbi:MAG: hypothetical protein ABF904_13545 [Ethanoligenens sp.]
MLGSIMITIAVVLVLETLHTPIGQSYAMGVSFMAGIVISFWAALRRRTQRISA